MDAESIARLAQAFESMPPVRAMALSPRACDGGRLTVGAPLAANVNDQGCAFGGSLASAMTLAAWGLVTLKLEDGGMAAEVYVADSRIRYRAPLYADLCAEAWLAEDSDWPAFLAELAARGRAAAETRAAVRLPEGGRAATMSARFVAVRRDPGSGQGAGHG